MGITNRCSLFLYIDSSVLSAKYLPKRTPNSETHLPPYSIHPLPKRLLSISIISARTHSVRRLLLSLSLLLGRLSLGLSLRRSLRLSLGGLPLSLHLKLGLDALPTPLRRR